MTSLRFVLAMVSRESRATGRRLLLLTTAISIGVGALVAVNSFTDNLRTALRQQSRALVGGDLFVDIHREPTTALRAAIDSMARAAGADSLRDLSEVTSFASMAYVPRTSGARLVRVSAIEGGYPFYGEVHTQPAGAWSRLAAGRVTLVDPSFLTALGAQVGDTMSLGESRFLIVGTIASFPGDVGIRSAFGPRVFIPARYLEETRLLLTLGSRADHEWFLRTPATAATRQFATTWRSRLAPYQARLSTVEEEEQDLQEFFDQLGRYLGLVALIALLLGGIGVGSAVRVFIRRKRDSIAVLRCLGATSGQVFSVYLVQAAVMGLAGSAIGVGLGVLLQLALPRVFGAFLPLDVQVRPSPTALLTGLAVGVWVALIFALLPLLSIRAVPPLAVLRRDVETTPGGRADRWTWAARATLCLSVVGLAILQVANPLRGALFSAGAAVALLVLWLAALALIKGIRRWFPHRLPYVFRQGLANLYRPANQTVAVVLALGFGAFLLGALAVAQYNLLRKYRLDGGIGRPNLVFFDIQPDQRAPVEGLIRAEGLPVQPAVPIVPMRLSAINGRKVQEILADTLNRQKPDGKRIEPWALRREYRSTYRDSVVASEKLVVGDWWAPGLCRVAPQCGGKARGPMPISLETEISTDLGVTVRDTLTWDIQGLQVTSVVRNIREVDWARFEPNFFVVFPDGPLADAPQSFVLLTRVDNPAVTGRLQRRIVEQFPNVTSIDLTSVRQTIERIVASVALAIRFMALFSLATGVVVLIGALATSRLQRIREAALLKTLGATRRQVVRIMVTEYAALGLLAAVAAVALASIAGWSLMKWLFKVPFAVPWGGFGLLALTMVALTVLTGLWNSLDVFRKAPLEVLRAD